MKNIAFIGSGNMAQAIINGLSAQSGNFNILAIDTHAPTRQHVADQFKVTTYADIDEKLRDFDVIVLAIKPYHAKEAIQALCPHLQSQLILSVVTGITIETFSNWLGGYEQIVRCIPNTPAHIGLGITGAFAPTHITSSQKEIAQQVLNAIGEVFWIPKEEDLDSITAIPGSGPAYVFYFIESLQKAAMQLGFEAETAKKLVLGTFLGAVKLAQTSNDPINTLRERVTSKGGTTAAALASFKNDQLEQAIIKGAMACYHRSQEISKEASES